MSKLLFNTKYAFWLLKIEEEEVILVVSTGFGDDQFYGGGGGGGYCDRYFLTKIPTIRAV